MRRLILTIFTIIYFAGQGIAQKYPIAVTPQVNAPAPVNFYNYADATAVNSPLRVQLLLNDITINNEQIRLKVYFEGNGIAFQSNDVVIGADPLFIDGGVTLTLTNVELAPYFEFQNILGITPNVYGQFIPEGSYQFCFEVFDFTTGNRLSSKSCATTYIYKNEPPILNLPFNKSNIEAKEVENIVFQWTPRHINVSNVEYELSIVEIWDDYVDPQAAFLSSQPVFETITRNTSFVYGPTQPLLLPNKRYAWRVKATALQGAEEIGLFRNEGYSEVFWFSRTSPCSELQFVSAEAKGISKINVFWDEDPNEYTEYTIAYREAGKPNAYWFTKRTNSGWATIWNLKPGTTYEYKVKAKCKYQYGEYSDIQEVTTETAEDETADYNCGIVPDEIAITNREPHPGLNIGERIKAGDFIITIVEIDSQSGGRITGRGYVGIPYLKFTRFGVKFNNVLINTDSQLAEGEIVTLYDPKYGENETMTVDLDIDVVETITGDQGETDFIELGFVVESITINEHGAIVVRGTNGLEETIPGGKDIEIKDANGKVWSIGKDNVIKVSEHAGEVTEATTEGVDEDGEILQISDDRVLVTFIKSGYYYFDELPEGAKGQLGKNSIYPTIPIKGGGTYQTAFKGISDTNGDDIVIAIADIKDESIATDDIIFKTKSGTAIPATWNGNKATLSLTKKFDYAHKKILATVKGQEEGKHSIVGVLNLVHLGSNQFADINVKLIPINKAVISREAQEEIKKVYKKAGVNLNIEVGNRLQIPQDVWDKEEPYDAINANERGLLCGYSVEEKAIIDYYKSYGTYDEETYYVFITDIDGEKSETEDLQGFMPIKSQFGFLFAGAVDKATIIAHELGHGIFGLEHPFKTYSTPKGTTGFIMDYGQNNIFNHMDWEEIFASGFKLFDFSLDCEGDGESVTIGSYYKDTEILVDGTTVTGGTRTYTFVTPSGELIVLPEDVQDVEFYYGYYGESLQGDFKQFMKFTPGTLKSFKIGDKQFDASVRFLGDGSAQLLGYFSGNKDDESNKFNNDEFSSNGWRNGVTNIMLHNGNDFVLTRTDGAFKPSLPKYDSSKISMLKGVDEFPVPNYTSLGQTYVLRNYGKMASDQFIVSSDIAKWAIGSNGGAMREDIFLQNKIAELKAAFPVLVDYVTSEYYGKWEACNSSYYEMPDYKFVKYLSNKYCSCELHKVDIKTYQRICTLKEGVDIPKTNMDFLKEFLRFLTEAINEEVQSTNDVIVKIKENVDYVNSLDINVLVRGLNFATEADINSLSSEAIIRIMSKMASENIFESKNESKDRENAVTKLIENIDEKLAGEIIEGLEGPNYYEPQKYIYKQFFKNVDDKFLGFFGENNRSRLIKSFVTLSLKAAEIRKNRIEGLIDDFEKRSFVLEYQNIVRRVLTQAGNGNPILKVSTELVSGEKSTYFSIDTSYDEDTGTFKGRQEVVYGLMPDFMADYRGEFTSNPLKPFDLVYFINNTKLEGVSQFGSKSHPEILPAIVLMYADKAASAETLSQSIMLAVDAASLATGVGAIASAATKLRYAVGVLELSSGLSGLTSTALSDAEAGSLQDELSKKFGVYSAVSGVLSMGLEAAGKIGKTSKIKDVYDSVDDSNKLVKAEDLLADLEKMPNAVKGDLVNDDNIFFIMYDYLDKLKLKTKDVVMKSKIKLSIDKLKDIKKAKMRVNDIIANLKKINPNCK